MAQVTKDTMIGDLLRIDAGVAPILMSIGMHGIDPEALVSEINKFLEKNDK